MALQFFDPPSSANGSLDFVTDYLLSNPKEDGRQFPVREVRHVESGKGYILSTDYFVCWLWMKSKTRVMLKEALDLYVHEQKGYQLFAVLDSKSKDKFRLAVDFDLPCEWFQVGNGYSVSQPQESPFTVSEGNPFLVSSPLTGEGEGRQRKQTMRNSSKIAP